MWKLVRMSFECLKTSLTAYSVFSINAVIAKCRRMFLRLLRKLFIFLKERKNDRRNYLWAWWYSLKMLFKLIFSRTLTTIFYAYRILNKKLTIRIQMFESVSFITFRSYLSWLKFFNNLSLDRDRRKWKSWTELRLRSERIVIQRRE